MGLDAFNKEAPINEIIGLLDSFDQLQLSELRDRHPEHARILKTGIPLGEEESQDEEKKLEELKVRAVICKTGLNLILKKQKQSYPQSRLV